MHCVPLPFDIWEKHPIMDIEGINVATQLMSTVEWLNGFGLDGSNWGFIKENKE